MFKDKVYELDMNIFYLKLNFVWFRKLFLYSYMLEFDV